MQRVSIIFTDYQYNWPLSYSKPTNNVYISLCNIEITWKSIKNWYILCILCINSGCVFKGCLFVGSIVEVGELLMGYFC